MSIKQYKLRELNKNPLMHKRVFVTYEDCLEALEKMMIEAIECGADSDKLMKRLQGESDEQT